MVYQNHLVASIKCNNKILREYDNNIVYLPFGSTYSILLKNLSNKKALASIYVDGRTVIDGLIVPPRSNSSDNTVEVERFIEGDFNKGHKLKFIEKTDEISEFRGDKIEDGIVRIVYQFEKTIPSFLYDTHPWTFYNSSGNRPIGTTIDNTSVLRSSAGDYSQTLSCNVNSTYSSSVNDQGITVDGEYSNQSFQFGNIGPLEKEENVLIFLLKGYTVSHNTVKDPIGSRDKIQCSTCGKKWKSNHKFCGSCGTCLV